MELLLKKYLWVVHVLLIAMMSYFLAKITGTIIVSSLVVDTDTSVNMSTNHKPVMTTKQAASWNDYKVISDRNIFDSRDIEPVASVPATSAPVTFDPNSPAVRTSLPVKLISTFSIGDGTDPRSTATIQNSQGGSGKPEVYKVNDENQFSPGVKITKILPNRVEFINGSRLEFVEMENVDSSNTTSTTSTSTTDNLFAAKNKNNSPIAGNKIIVDQVELDNAFSKLDVLLSQINIGPNLDKSGKASGVKINNMDSKSIFKKLGLQSGDVLKQLNGEELDMTKGIMLFGQLKDQKRFNLDIERRGQRLSFEYEVR